MAQGQLLDWQAVEEREDWGALLLGNGLSINVWKGFEYKSLFDEAREFTGPLSSKDLRLFEKHGTENFEVVLHALTTSIKTAEALDLPVDELLRRHRSIQVALGEAIRRVHLGLGEVPETARETIKEVLCEQSVVFSTNYDLLVYWAMGFPDGYGNLVDCMYYNLFDSANCRPGWNKTPVWFLHGAMHLAVDGQGVTRKVTRTADETVLAQFGRPVNGDPRSRPLLVTEGDSSDKLRAIHDNDYLRHALGRFEACRDPLVVFGSTLSIEQDGHLLDAINRHEGRPVAVSMRRGTDRNMRRRQALIESHLDSQEVVFFDATSHPLGRIHWSREVERWRQIAAGGFQRRWAA